MSEWGKVNKQNGRGGYYGIIGMIGIITGKGEIPVYLLKYRMEF